MTSADRPARSARPRVKRIRTDVGREAQGISGVRDAGISVGYARQRQRSPYPVMTIIAAVLGLAMIGWMLSWETAPSEESVPALTASAAPLVAAEPERDPTPLLAVEGETQLHLAVDPDQLTAVAFHQAAGDSALGMTSLVPDADMALAAQLKAVPPVPEDAVFDDGVWRGVVLRLWRSGRGGQPDTAVDMGAGPGTPVWSPVTGTVVDVKPYLLYDAHEDFEIHIKPEGRDDVDVVLIHVTDVKVKPGDRVKGGVTQLASIRKMSDKIEIQLGGYTANGGDHVHVQLNRIDTGGALPAPGDS